MVRVPKKGKVSLEVSLDCVVSKLHLYNLISYMYTRIINIIIMS